MLYDEAIHVIWYLACMLITTIVLLIVFSISGVLDHLFRFLRRHQTRDQFDDVESASSLQGQLSQLFHLQGQLSQLFHLFDSGLDQSFIDTLPVFLYKDITGLKNPNFDCVVCLCEFEPDDNLRLLPKCSHAFHVECIDTWLLSRSTCPLCRAILQPVDYLSFRSNNNNNASREIVLEGEGYSVVLPRSSTSSECSDGEFGSTSIHVDENPDTSVEMVGAEKVVTVKLGKFRNVDGDGEGSSTGNNVVDVRRSYSMGSLAYVMGEDVNVGRTETKTTSNGNVAAAIGRNKKESFSLSKIWLRGNVTE